MTYLADRSVSDDDTWPAFGQRRGSTEAGQGKSEGEFHADREFLKQFWLIELEGWFQILQGSGWHVYIVDDDSSWPSGLLPRAFQFGSYHFNCR